MLFYLHLCLHVHVMLCIEWTRPMLWSQHVCMSVCLSHAGIVAMVSSDLFHRRVGNSFSLQCGIAILWQGLLNCVSNGKGVVALLSQRARAMLRVCQQLAPIVLYVKRNLLLLVTSASDLLLRAIKLFFRRGRPCWLW